MQPQAISPQGLMVKTTGIVMWLVKNHWFWVSLILGTQYVSGKVIGSGFVWLAPLFSYPTWRQIHMFNSNLVVGVVMIMLGVKVFLWLRKRGKI